MNKYLIIISFFLYQAASSQIPRAGLLAYYPLNGNATDSSGNGYNGTVVGPTVDSGECKLAYNFVNDYIDCGNPAGNVFDITNDASICLWFKLNSAIPGNGGYNTLFGKDVSGGSVPKWFMAITNDSVAFHVNGPSWGSGYWRYSDPFHFGADTFYHLVITKHVDTFQFFINTIPYGIRSYPVNVLTVPATVHIGQNEAAPVNAVIDEVLFYNRVLSPFEIVQVYNACEPVPVTANFSTPDTLLCAGSCLSFTNFSVNANSYQWSFPGATISSGTGVDPGNVCYTTPGSYNVQLIVSNGITADTLLRSNYITVNPLPLAGTITADPDSGCAGLSSQLADTGSTAGIQWQSSFDGISYSNLPNDTLATFISPVLLQTTYYRAMTNSGCGTDTSMPVVIIVNPLPPFPSLSTNDSVICSSDSTLIRTSGSYFSYLWSDGDTLSYTYAHHAGGYWVSVTDANGCSVVSGHQDISVFPISSVSILVQGDTLASFNSAFYQWFFNDSLIGGATGPILIVNQTGLYSVEVTDTNGCSTISNSIELTTGISALEDERISIYPNPFAVASVQLTVGSELVGSALEVYNDEGRLVFHSKLQTPNSKLDLDFPSGVYYLRISNENVIVVRKLVKIN